MAGTSLGDHLVAARAELVALQSAVVALTAELAAVRAELDAINGKTPTLVNGSLPIRTDQLPATLANGKVKVTGLL